MKSWNKPLRAASCALIAAGLFVSAIPVAATQQGEQRRAGRDVRQDTRQGSRQAKADCRQANQKSNAGCRQDKRQTKQGGRQQARDIKY